MTSKGEIEVQIPSPKLRLQEVVPYLNLPSNRGGTVNLWNFKQRENLVIIFYHGVGCSHCRRYLEGLAAVYDEVLNNEAEVLAVSCDPLDRTRKYVEKIPFPLLSSSSREAVEKFTYIDEARKAPFPSILITDRYGALRYQKVVKEAEDLPTAREVLDWLHSIEIECPECSHL